VCEKYTQTGTYDLPIFKSGLSLVATVTQRSVGSEVTLSKVGTKVQHTGDRIFRISVTGSMPKLTLKEDGTLLQFSPKGPWSEVNSIFEPGVYEVFSPPAGFCPPGQAKQGNCGQPCPPGQYKKGNCEQFPHAGTYSISVPSTDVTLLATITAAGLGAEVNVDKVTMSHPHATGFTFKVFSGGGKVELTVTGKRSIYSYNPATDSWSKVSKITEDGIYEVVHH
jgi:hypothetical protein